MSMTTVVWRKRIVYEPRGRALEYAPLAVSLYHGCEHGCTYCYAPSALKMDRANFLKPYVRKDALIRLEKDAAELASIGDTREILMSFTTDPYQPIEEKLRITRAALEILMKYKLHVNILTKNGLLSTRDFDILAGNKDLCRYGTTLTFTDPEDRIKFEPNASPTEHRIAALQMAHKRGISTWSSIEPVFYPEQSLDLIRKTVGFVDEYKIGKLNHMEEYKVSEKEMTVFVLEVKRILDDAGKRYIFKKDLYPYLQKAGIHTYKPKGVT